MNGEDEREGQGRRGKRDERDSKIALHNGAREGKPVSGGGSRTKEEHPRCARLVSRSLRSRNSLDVIVDDNVNGRD